MAPRAQHILCCVNAHVNQWLRWRRIAQQILACWHRHLRGCFARVKHMQILKTRNSSLNITRQTRRISIAWRSVTCAAWHKRCARCTLRISISMTRAAASGGGIKQHQASVSWQQQQAPLAACGIKAAWRIQRVKRRSVNGGENQSSSIIWQTRGIESSVTSAAAATARGVAA